MIECRKCHVAQPRGQFYPKDQTKPPARGRTCIGCVSTYNKDRWRTPEVRSRGRANTRTYRAANKEKYARYNKDRMWGLMVEALLAHGGVCQACGDAELKRLELDHVNNDGKEDRGKNGPLVQHLTRLRDLNWVWEYDLQVLCANCNRLKEIERRGASTTPQGVSYRRMKVKVLDTFAGGSRCACCGEDRIELLDTQHLDKDGPQHRAEISGSAAGKAFYEALNRLRKAGEPCAYRLGVLCRSCHLAEDRRGGCPGH